VASKPCSRCDERIRGKSAAFYWAWFPEPANRRCVLCRLCPTCAADVLTPLLTRPKEDRDLCVQCGSYPDADPATTYLTVFIPNREQYDDEWQTCGPCAVFFREAVARGGELQPDRGVGVRGPSPSSIAWDAIPIPA